MRRLLLVLTALAVTSCGVAGQGATSKPSSTPPAPSTAAVTAVGEQLFPFIKEFNYYAECINFPEHGAGLPNGAGNDYSACPLNDSMRARLQATQAHLCGPCEQNPSPTREIKAVPKPGGGQLTVKLYGGHLTVEMVLINQNGKLVVSDEPAKGSFETTPTVFQNPPKPTPTPTLARPTSRPQSGVRILNVPWYKQAYVLSCEAASLRMALAYQGIATTDKAILDIVGSDPRPPIFVNGAMQWGDPFAAFVGNVNGSEIALTGYGMYHSAVVKAANRLGGRVLSAGQHIPPAQIYSAILAGHPSVVWVTYHWVTLHRQDYVAFDGRTIPYAGPGEHAVTVVGIDAGRVLINNPWSGPEWIAKSLFEHVYATYDQMAVILA